MSIDNVVKINNKPLLTKTNNELYRLFIKNECIKPISHLHWNIVYKKQLTGVLFTKTSIKVLTIK